MVLFPVKKSFSLTSGMGEETIRNIVGEVSGVLSCFISHKAFILSTVNFRENDIL